MAQIGFLKTPKYEQQNRAMLRCRVAERMLLLLQAREQQNFLRNFVAEVALFTLCNKENVLLVGWYYKQWLLTL